MTEMAVVSPVVNGRRGKMDNYISCIYYIPTEDRKSATGYTFIKVPVKANKTLSTFLVKLYAKNGGIKKEQDLYGNQMIVDASILNNLESDFDQIDSPPKYIKMANDMLIEKTKELLDNDLVVTFEYPVEHEV